MKRITTVLVFLLACLAAAAQEVTLTVDAPESAVAGERFRIIYTINSTDGQFTRPKFDPSFSVQGPQQSTNRNVQWINGDMKVVSSTTLIYYVTAGTPGTYTIPAAQFETKRVTVSSQEKQIVIYDGDSSQQATGRQQGQTSAAGDAPASGSEVSMRILLSDRDVYAGQPITGTLKLYTRINLSGIQELKLPDFKGFLKEDIETPPLRSLDNEVIDGVQYGTGVIQRFVLYPQIAGEIRIEPAEMTALVQERTAARDPFFNDPFFDSFFSSVSTVPRKITTQPLTVRVRPLPEPRPADFHGAVGSFTIESSVSATDAKLNDAVTLTVTLKGSGNLNLAGEPVISFPQGIEKYDPKVTVRSSGISAGSKVFEYLLIPRNTGTFEIPPVSYSVFDPGQEKYVTLRTGGFTLNVTGTPGQEEGAAPVYIPGEDVKYIGQDIRFIRNGNGRLTTLSSPLVASLHYWLWFALALFIALLVLVIRKQQIRRNADKAGMRNRRAAKNARKRLSRATALLKSGKKEEVNAEVARALWGYLGDKLRIDQSDLTREKCYTALRERKADEEMITELDRILTATEYSQYAPVSEVESPAALCERAALLIGKLDNVLD
ncbi:MAG TPA: BatD family protein [Bacteroidales bacterium]|nr:BatD family protein [Bacteroidales bacterium]HPX53351.1 BatD family protein [Bacteroidales bacterium]HQI12000.1 BatD family protein [Bacteroidales bacterium]